MSLSFTFHPNHRFEEQIPHTKIIYTIHDNKRQYIGMSNNKTRRLYEHYNSIRTHIRRRHIDDTHIKPHKNLYVHRYISAHDPSNFTHTPIIRMHEADAHAFEFYCIRYIRTNALNTDIKSSSQTKIPSLVTSKKSTRNKTQKQRRKKYKLNTQQQEKQQPKRKNIAKPMLLSEKGKPIFFHRLDSILQKFENQKITMICRPGKAICNLKPVIYSFGRSTIHNHNKWKKLPHFIESITTTNRSHGTHELQITPTRTLTTTQRALIFLERQTTNKAIDTKIAEKFDTIFWLHLFRVAHKHHNARTSAKIRRFIKLYIFISYKIPPEMITGGISLNLVLDFQPHTSLGAITACHHAIISAHANTISIKNKIYTSFRKPKPLESLINNSKAFINKFEPNNPFECKCESKHKNPAQHKIVMPFEMSLKESKILRNLAQPDIIPQQHAILHITKHILSLLNKLRTLRLTKVDQLLEKSLTFDYSTSTIIIQHAQGNPTKIKLGDWSTCLELCTYHFDITDIHSTVEFFKSYPAPTGSSDTSLKRIHKHLCKRYPIRAQNSTDKQNYKILRSKLETDKNQEWFTPKSNTGLEWIVRFYLTVNKIQHTQANIIMSFFKQIQQNNSNIKQHRIPGQVREVLRKHSGSVWLAIDHNARQYARVCPLKFHDILMTIFLRDPKQYRVITNTVDQNKPSLDPVTTSKFIRKNLNSRWLAHSYKYKPHILANLFVMVKLDGVRFRTVGSYTKVPHKKLLSHAGTALLAILRCSGLHHLGIFSTGDFKGIINDFDSSIKNLDKWIINFTTFDVKNFYSEVQKQHLKPRLTFVKKSFQKTNKTNYISIPKKKTNKLEKPHPGRNNSSDYLTFHVDDIMDICDFASTFAFFTLGNIVLQQISGLPTGCPLSGPAAFVYVSYDEHFAKTTTFIKTISTEYHLATCRFADDIFLGLAVPHTLGTQPFEHLCNFYMNDIYERDLPEKNLVIKIDNESNKFLDSDVIVYNNRSRIKTIYHNKNDTILETDRQEIGRFHDDAAKSSDLSKINAINAILVKIADSTTYRNDMLKPTMEVMYELKCLHYKTHKIRAAMLKVNRSRPSPIWMQTFSALFGQTHALSNVTQ